MSSSTCYSFASYLAGLDSGATLSFSPTDASSSSAPSWSATSSDAGLTSPQKRPRSDSPDTDCSSQLESVSFYESTTTIKTAKGAIRSILHHSTTTITNCPIDDDLSQASSSMPPSPGPSSRPLSRRSSTGMSSKAVRFARCTNASVFPALGAEEYDRSPIVPSTEAESLALPKRKEGEAERGWIKCVERERAAEKAKRCAPHPSPSVSLVEGVHGLVEGGYFVGEERAERMDEDEEMNFVDDEEMTRDDEDDEEEEEEDDAPVSEDDAPESLRMTLPGLVSDDTSADDSESLASIAESASELAASTPQPELSSTPIPSSPSPAALSAGRRTPSPPRGLGFGFMERSTGEVEEEVTEEEERAMAEREAAEEKQRTKKCRERFGLCALGKYTRAEVFSSYDSLGGF